jgi:hypothetical protein
MQRPSDSEIEAIWARVLDIELMMLEITHEDIVARFGPGLPDACSDAPGPCIVWKIEPYDDLVVILQHHTAKGFTVLYANSLELDFIKSLMGFREMWRIDLNVIDKRIRAELERCYGTDLFDLIRIDDNGVEYAMFSKLGKYEAKYKLADFESRHHKQTYFLRKST